MRALFLSPHLDDVAFSCGGTFATLAARAWETTLCTVFTRSVAHPAGFALACQLDKGLGPEIDYLALRRAEDDAAAALLGASQVERLDLPEAPHRGYESAPALFGAFAAADRIAPEIEALLRLRLRGYDVVFAPQGLGDHVDHRRVRDAVRALVREAAIDARVAWYRDAPYALRNPGAVAAGSDASVAFAVALDEPALEAKLNACAAYRSQLAFQFGSETAMRDALRAFARDEGARFGVPSPGETFRSEDRRAAACLHDSRQEPGKIVGRSA